MYSFRKEEFIMKKNKLAKMAAAVLMTGSIAALGTSKVNAEDGGSVTSKQSTATFTIDTSKAKLTLRIFMLKRQFLVREVARYK